jgi:hypothetical protein
MCGGFTCSKNALTALNILYIVRNEYASEVMILIMTKCRLKYCNLQNYQKVNTGLLFDV